MNYYEQIKESLINNEVYKKVKDYSKNRNDLITYYNVGKLLIEAQGGIERAKYGNKLIKEYSNKLIKEVGKKYDYTQLSRMRQFYITFRNIAPMAQLSWSHYQELLPLKNMNKINYYIKECIKYNLSRNKLREKIRNKEYERLPDSTKDKLTNNEKNKIEDFIKNPIIIKTNQEIINEKILHQVILENIDDFLKELGDGFSYISHEYKIKINNTCNYIDLLLFNYIYNSFVVIELKTTELKKEHIGQIEVYINYINKHIKKVNHNDTIGIIISKEDNKYLIKYSSDPRIFNTKYLTI